ARAPAPAAGDIDQLLAEAGVYLRYGKHERAMASLESVLAREAEHPLALELLGEALAATRDTERALEAWLRPVARGGAAGRGPRGGRGRAPGIAGAPHRRRRRRRGRGARAAAGRARRGRRARGLGVGFAGGRPARRHRDRRRPVALRRRGVRRRRRRTGRGG